MILFEPAEINIIYYTGYREKLNVCIYDMVNILKQWPSFRIGMMNGG